MKTSQTRSKLWLYSLLVLSAVAIGIWLWQGQPAKQGAPARPSVTIAANLPMTGELGNYGTIFQRGIQMALDDLRVQDPSGPEINFDWGDNSGDTQTTVTVMQRQLLRSPDLYMSALKPQVMAITSQLSEKAIPHFTWVLDIKVNPSTSNNLRVWVNFGLESQVFLDYMKPRNPKRIAIMYFKTPAVEEEYNDVIAPALKSRGAEEILIERLEWNTSDYATLAAKIAAFKPDMLILNGFIPQLTQEIRALRPFGLIHDGNTLASLDMLDAAPLLGADEKEGIVVAAPEFLTRPDSARAHDWKLRFQQRFKEAPSYHSAYAYDTALVIHEAAKRLKLPATSAQWIAAIRATQIEGVTGVVRFNEDGSSITKLEPAHFISGELVPLTP